MIRESHIDLSNGDASLRIALRGAEPIAWTVADTPLLWSPDPSVWAQVAPILFPVVGWTRGGEIRHKGRSYPLGLHGFASGQDFALVDHDGRQARLRLKDSPATRACYPFPFQLDAHYRLEEESLVWSLEISNTGMEPLPYAIGVHPGFCWPLAQSQSTHDFRFDRDEQALVPVIAPGGLFSSETKAVPLHQGALTLSPDLLAQEALCFLNIASKGAIFTNGEGASLRCDFDNFAHLALWGRPPAPFLCIEAWTGYGDPVGFTGEISEKPSMCLLAPGAQASHCARFTFSQG